MKNFLTIFNLILCLQIIYCVEFKRVCYFTNWSNKLLVQEARFQLVDIDPSLCTHIIYAFANIDGSAKRLIKSAKDDDNGQLGEDAKGRYFDFTALKKTNPNLVTLLSVGGANNKDFPSVSTRREERQLFARNCRIYLRDRNFDGLDIDWEYPSDIYRDDFTEMLKELREEFEKEGKETNRPRLIITIATAGGANHISASYNITEIVKYVDFINVMAYDYFGPWSKVTGFSSPLWSRLSDNKFSAELSQDWTIQRWINGGAPPEMLVLGTTGAGVAFELNNTKEHGIGAIVNGPYAAGPLLKQSGHLSYFEICTVLNSGATVKWDQEQNMSYAYINDQWIGYDTPRSMKEKVKYAINKGLGGIMFWSFDLDDFYGGQKYCKNGRFPLLKAIRDAVAVGITTVPPSTGQNNQQTTSDRNSTSNETEGSTSETTTKQVYILQTERPNDDHIKVFILDGSEMLRTNIFLIVLLSVLSLTYLSCI